MVCFYLYGHIKIYIYNTFYGLFLSIWTYKDIYVYNSFYGLFLFLWTYKDIYT